MTVACFVVGFALLATSRVQVLIPETGQSGLDWIRDVDESSNVFFVRAWLVVFGGLFSSMGVVLLRRREREELVPAPTS